MLFNSATYLIFLPLVFALYWTMRSGRSQNVVLLLASMVFYGWWSVEFLGLMLLTCLLNYVCVRLLTNTSRPRLWLCMALLLNFGILGVFKYFNFFAGNLAALFSLFGLHADMVTLNVILPVGISFYTFQLSAYVIDCYRGDRDARQDSLLDFLTFITFFPQLVAGPIERANHLMPQMKAKRSFDAPAAIDGMRLILWGLMKKMLLADNCAAQVDYVFSNYDSVSAPTLWLGTLYFTFQIYGDFSGYSDMAIGSARLFGIRLSPNFNRPYLAVSPQDFWRRWHMSLMSWFRDYVYIPLGGNRKGTLRQRLNLAVVFLLSGFWHGANWTFVLWGLFHALVYRLPLRWLTFLFVMIGFTIFRSPDVFAFFGYLQSMFDIGNMGPSSCSRSPLLLIALLMLTEWRMGDAAHPFRWRDTGWQRSQIVRYAVYLILFTVTVVWGGMQTQFIYFQF